MSKDVEAAIEAGAHGIAIGVSVSETAGELGLSGPIPYLYRI